MDTKAERFAHRLREAIHAWRENGIRQFAKEMAGVRGGSYAAIRSYLAGKADPPAAFIEAAADRLGVKLEWLWTGRGPRHSEPDPDHVRLAHAAWEAARSEMPAFFDGETGISAAAARRVQQAIQSLVTPIWVDELSGQVDHGMRDFYFPRDPEDAGQHTEPEAQEIGRRVTQFLTIPLETIGVSLASVGPDVLDRYAASASETLVGLSEHLRWQRWQHSTAARRTIARLRTAEAVERGKQPTDT